MSAATCRMISREMPGSARTVGSEEGMNLWMVLGAGVFAFLGFVAIALWAAFVAASRADDEMDRLAAEMGWRDDGDPWTGI